MRSLPRSLAVNLPIYLVPALLVHRARLLGPRGPELALRAAVGCLTRRPQPPPPTLCAPDPEYSKP